MTEPGVAQSEAQLCETISVVIYDGSKLDTEKILALYKERTSKNWEASLVSDRPLSSARQ